MLNVLNPLFEFLLKLLGQQPGAYKGVMGVFFYVDDATRAVESLRQMGHKNIAVISPVPHHAIDEAMEQGPSLVRWITFFGGMTGAVGGMTLCIYSVLSYPLVTGGKELISVPPFIIPTYESMILLGGLANLIGMLALARLPHIKLKAPYDPRFSEDRIGIWVPSEGADAKRVQELLRGQGAEEASLHA
jgi:hypothetical protein